MTSVVFDCNVFLQAALRFESPAFTCFEECERHGIQIHVSAGIVREYHHVLTRDSLREKFPILTDAFVEERLTQFLAKTALIEDPPRVFEYIRDPKDEKYLNLAIAGGAHFLVSRDRDLLDVMTDATFRTKHASLAICTPEQFLERVKTIR